MLLTQRILRVQDRYESKKNKFSCLTRKNRVHCSFNKASGYAARCLRCRQLHHELPNRARLTFGSALKKPDFVSEPRGDNLFEHVNIARCPPKLGFIIYYLMERLAAENEEHHSVIGNI